MSIATLGDIIAKIRKLTVTSNSSQLTDAQIVDYINSYYIYDFPAQFRSLKLKDVYVFNTTKGVDTYPFDYENWSTVEAPCYCEKIPIQLYQSPNGFRGINFNWQTVQQLTTSTGVIGPYTGTLQNTPILRSVNNNPMVKSPLTSTQVFPNGIPVSFSPSATGFITAITQAANASVTSVNHGLTTGTAITIRSVLGMTEVNGLSFVITVVNSNTFTLNIDSTTFTAYVSGGTWTTVASNQKNYPNISRVQNLLITVNVANGITLNVSDDGAGNLIGDGSGTVNYETGAISVTFAQAPPSGEVINVQYIPVVLNIPQSIMYYQSQFTMRPVPDKGYTVEVTAYRLPSQALLGTSSSTEPNLAGVPEQREWWEVLCFGAAKKIYQDRIDNEGVQTMEMWLQEAMSNAETRTYAQLGKQRTATIYGDQSNNVNGNGNAFGWGGGAGLGQ